MGRVFNFSAGPAVLPEPVLQQAADEMLDWHGAGCGVMEMSHRGKEFMSIIAEAEADLRELMGIPTNYRVLFLQGGATLQFAQIPLNLLQAGAADYVITGSWSDKAYKEAKRVCGESAVRLVGTTKETGFTRRFAAGEVSLNDKADYLHICTNETIHGVEAFATADLLGCAAPQGVPVVADMSSHILSAPVNVADFGLIYAGAQKNIGPAGLTLVIVRDDLIGKAGKTIPSLLDYAVQAEHGSMLNTPPTYGIYLAGLVFKWLKAQGGLTAMADINARKAALLYDYLDQSSLFENRVAKDSRSQMNVPFLLRDESLNDAFLAGAKAAGLSQLKGHKSVGGMRASIYNAMPVAGVQALVDYLREFERKA